MRVAFLMTECVHVNPSLSGIPQYNMLACVIRVVCLTTPLAGKFKKIEAMQQTWAERPWGSTPDPIAERSSYDRVASCGITSDAVAETPR